MEYLVVIIVVCLVIAGLVAGSHDLLVYIHAPEAFTWAVPLGFILVIMSLFTFWAATQIYSGRRK